MKNVPNLRFKEFSGEWESNKIEKICDIITDYVAAGSFENIRNSVTYYNSENFAQLVRTIDLKSNFNNKDFIFVDEKAYNFLYRVNLNEDSIILPNIGANIGESYYVEPEKLPSENNVLGPNAILLRSEINNTKYIYYLFNTKAFHKQLVQIIGASGQPKFNKTELKQMKFYVPTIEEQEKIASFFSLIDKKIELQTEKVEELKNYKKGLMQKIFSQELRFKDENGNEYPEWEEKTLGYFLSESKIKGDTGDRAKKLTVKLWAKGIVEKRDDIQGSAETQYYIRKAGQLMYGKLDFLNCAFGIVPKELDGFQSTLDAPAFDVRNANSIFLLNRIIQKDFYKKNGDIADGSRKAKRIHVDTFLNMKLFMPTLEEQNKIASFFSLIDKKLELEMEKLEQLQEYKKGLLQQMFI